MHDPPQQHADRRAHELQDSLGAMYRLAVQADCACARSDAGTLESITRQLAFRAIEPLHGDLLDLAEECRYEPVAAIQRWPELRERLYRAT
jgi:hypothetical protein